MSIDITETRSRRALLVGAIGGVSALVAHALGKPNPMLAGGGSVQLGATNTSNGTTIVQNLTNEDVPLLSRSTKGDGFVGRGATSGVVGVGNPGPGVRGSSVEGILASRLPQRVGVLGLGDRAGVQGKSANRVGVLGVAGGAGPSSMPPNAGVYGWSNAEGAGVSYGVLGRSTALHGYGVFGTSDRGSGVQAFTESGVAVVASVTGGGSGRALLVNGQAHFSTSGLATVAAGSDKKVVTPGFGLSISSKVLATLMGNAGGSVVLKRVAIDAVADTFTILLTGNAANDVSVAWFVLE